MSITTTSGAGTQGPGDRLVAGRGLRDHLDVRVGVEQEPEGGPQQRLVVGEQNANGHKISLL
jgi:hypothetical protein